MSTFCCEKCGALCVDTERGYITGCSHYPAEVRPFSWEVENLRGLSESLNAENKPVIKKSYELCE